LFIHLFIQNDAKRNKKTLEDDESVVENILIRIPNVRQHF
jgi:hypothetical protein